MLKAQWVAFKEITNPKGHMLNLNKIAVLLYLNYFVARKEWLALTDFKGISFRLVRKYREWGR